MATEGFDGDRIALTSLMGLAKSPDEKAARLGVWGLSGAANPSNLDFYVDMYGKESDPTVRLHLLEALTPLSEYDPVRKLARRATTSPNEHEAQLGPEILLSAQPPPPDTLKGIPASGSSRHDWVRDSLYNILADSPGREKRRELVNSLCNLGDERMLEYLEGMPSEGLYKGACYSTLILALSRRSGDELPATQRQQIYQKLLSGAFSANPELCDIYGDQYRLRLPDIRTMWDSKTVYVLDENLTGLPPLEVGSFDIYCLSIWELKRIANRQERPSFHIRFDRIYAYQDYAVVSVGVHPTVCPRHSALALCGGGLTILLRRINSEWRLQKVLWCWTG